jgi:hypothetical protein
MSTRLRNRRFTMVADGRNEGYSTRPATTIPRTPSYQDRSFLSPLDAWEVHPSKSSRLRSADASANNAGTLFDNLRGGWDGWDDRDDCSEDGSFEMMAETSTSADASVFRYAHMLLCFLRLFFPLVFDFAMISYSDLYSSTLVLTRLACIILMLLQLLCQLWSRCAHS